MIDNEMVRLHELAVGKHWVNDPEQLLYCCLANIKPKDSHLVEFEKPLSPSYAEVAKLLYQVVGQSDADRIKVTTRPRHGSRTNLFRMPRLS